MPTREGSAHWQGTLKAGQGTVRTASGAVDADLSFGSRFEEAAGTNPEELIGAAHAACFSMALAMMLAEADHPPDTIHTRAKVTLDKTGDGFAITGVHLHTRATVPGMDDDEFQKHAEAAKKGCPVSKALQAVDISLQADLAS
ncbi:MAG TPA: OsmC family protein [Methylomirabilota bacterium]|nr:OsmC family protein [Methylomirabilota bacterium]